MRFKDTRRSNAARRELLRELVCLSQKPDARVRMPDLLIARGHGDGDEPGERPTRYPRITRLAHFDQDRGTDAKGDRGEELVRNAEERPETVDPTQRVHDSLQQEIAPRRTDNGGGQHYARIPTRPSQRL